MYKKPRDSNLSDAIYENSDLLGDLSRFDLYRRRRSDLDDDPAVKFGDDKNEYNLNSLGFRSKEFGPVDLITAGCSYTYGVGIPEEGIWSSIFAKKVGLDHANLALPGWSIEAIVEALFNYFYTHGNPKYVVMLLPEFDRAILPSRLDLATIGSAIRGEPHTILFQDTILSKVPAKHRARYGKKPYDLLEILPPEFGLLQAFKALNSLVMYCRAADIKLVWGTWLHELDFLLNISKKLWNKDAYSGYISLLTPITANLNDLPPVCHSLEEEQYKELFYRGVDRDKHPGIHLHLHYADMFYQKYLEYQSS